MCAPSEVIREVGEERTVRDNLFSSERVAKTAAWFDWTVVNDVADSGCCKACTRSCAATMAE